MPLLIPIISGARCNSGLTISDLLLVLWIAIYSGALVIGMIDSSDSRPFNNYAKRIFFTYGIGHFLGKFLFKTREESEK